jgi:hypothetical protein
MAGLWSRSGIIDQPSFAFEMLIIFKLTAPRPHIVTSIGKLTRSAANAASRTLNEAGAE